jgi:hypothetical protein
MAEFLIESEKYMIQSEEEGIMAFEELGRLEDQLDELQSKSGATGDSVLRARIMTFVKEVYLEMEVAFDGVNEILSEVVNARKSQLNEKFVSELLDKLDYSHYSKKLRSVLKFSTYLGS